MLMQSFSDLKEKFLTNIFKHYGDTWHYGLIQKAFQRHAKIIRFKYQPSLRLIRFLVMFQKRGDADNKNS